jgi:hypothetical protein
MPYFDTYYVGSGAFCRTESDVLDRGTGNLTVDFVGQGVWTAAPYTQGQRAAPHQIRTPKRKLLEADYVGCGVYARTTRQAANLEEYFVAGGAWVVPADVVRIQTEKQVVCSVRGMVDEVSREIVTAVRQLIESERNILVSTRAYTASEKDVLVAVRQMVEQSREIRCAVRGLTTTEAEIRLAVRAMAARALSVHCMVRGLVQSERTIACRVRTTAEMTRLVRAAVRALVTCEAQVQAGVRGMVSAERSILCRVRAGEPLAYLITGTGQATKVAMANGASSVQVQDGRAEPQTGETQATTAMKDGQTTAQII